jgi:hypothetical protein
MPLSVTNGTKAGRASDPGTPPDPFRAGSSGSSAVGGDGRVRFFSSNLRFVRLSDYLVVPFATLTLHYRTP